MAIKLGLGEKTDHQSNSQAIFNFKKILLL